jgi:hypothetical protein
MSIEDRCGHEAIVGSDPGFYVEEFHAFLEILVDAGMSIGGGHDVILLGLVVH